MADNQFKRFFKSIKTIEKRVVFTSKSTILRVVKLWFGYAKP
jgi:hypothetical protein